MGTEASPNLVLTIIDLSTGNPDSGETVEILLDGDTYPGDAIALSEIGVTGRYKKVTAGGVDAVLQGVYHVYVGETFNGIFVHGYTGIADHLASSADPHSVAAEQVSVVDSEPSYYSSNDVEAILAEIGADLETKADTDSTVLLDNSSQSVTVGKPVVTNLNSDKVDGRHAGASAGNLPILDGNATIPLDNIPDTLTGKDADTVDGKHVGTVAGKIAQIGGGAGRLGVSMLNKVVGSSAGNIPVISNTQQAGKLDYTLLAKRLGTVVATDIPTVAQARHRTATHNQGDSPDPDIYGGGTVWLEELTANNTTPVIVDDSIDWRDRFITIQGKILESSLSSDLPGGGDDDGITTGLEDGNEPVHLAVGMFYSEAGNSGAGNDPGWRFRPDSGADYIYIWADDSDGKLKMGKASTSNGNQYAVTIKIDYSPDQGHI